ncbi:iron-siderophore ABC transporter substrate-binding protein [Mycolicibacterium sp. CBMA 226]|uniref:iron-siderophore ABC transporter substrate-binding protein n=1 Tax=Mycolicibacterium sp. CBMA 226 TaxID=2606611 RepID=UPI001309F3F7|nr:iron-siderophore ABC transporter substrate-binding protein [Mycolicibacterium sp. CBMA 226]MUL79230.1 iron-siderophore ABC transporter substrate-binding protein [Mycolicibacterium sp. CBMA 226]
MQFPTPRTRLSSASAAVLTALCATAATVLTGCSGHTSEPQAANSAPITSTTRIATAGVLGNARRPDDSCAPDPAALDPDVAGGGPPTRSVHHAAGATDVKADPQRIVVLSGTALDALCALGLQSRVVAAATPTDSSGQTSYLGTVVHNVPAAGTRSAPDMAAIKAANPDLIIGSQASATSDTYGGLSAIAPTVLTGPSGAAWQDDLRMVGAATGRGVAAGALVDGFNADATRVGGQNDAAHFQVSVVQLTEGTLRVWGTSNFPGSVLARVGADRPAPQRFTDKPYHEIDISKLGPGTDFSTADGDIVYLSFESPAAKDRAAALLNGPAWKKLAATRDNRVFVVNNEVWQTGQGIVAARGVLDDLHWLNAPIN